MGRVITLLKTRPARGEPTEGGSRDTTVIAHLKTRPARGEPTEQNSTRGGQGGNLNRSVDSTSRLLGSATSNEANKSAIRRAEWTITARRAVLRLAQMKYPYFVPEHCKQNAIGSDTGH